MYYGSQLDDFVGLEDFGVFGALGAKTKLQRQEAQLQRLLSRPKQTAAVQRQEARLVAAGVPAIAPPAKSYVAYTGQPAPQNIIQTSYVGSTGQPAPQNLVQTVCKFGARPDTGACFPSKAAARKYTRQHPAAKQISYVCGDGTAPDPTTGLCASTGMPPSGPPQNIISGGVAAGATGCPAGWTQMGDGSCIPPGGDVSGNISFGGGTGLTRAQQRHLDNLQKRLERLLSRPNQTPALLRQEQRLAAQIQAAGGTPPDLSAVGGGGAVTTDAGIDLSSGLPVGMPGQPTCPDGSMPDPTTGICVGAAASTVAPAPDFGPAPAPMMYPAPAPAPGYDYSQNAPPSYAPAPGGGGFGPMDAAAAGAPMGIDPSTGLPIGQQPPAAMQPSPSEMSTTTDVGQTPGGLSNTTMLVIAGGALLLWFMLSKKGKK